jgi:hypothetical protein
MISELSLSVKLRSICRIAIASTSTGNGGVRDPRTQLPFSLYVVVAAAFLGGLFGFFVILSGAT